MGTREYRVKTAQIIDNRDLDYCLVDDLALVYYRQSHIKQRGNTQTEAQTEDLKELLIEKGWHLDNIMIIALDEGYSGKLAVSKRPGFSCVMEIIQRIPRPVTLCMWDEDRSFRDDEMIEVNECIKIFKKHKTRIITKDRQYYFAHPERGREDIRRFREEIQRAADYLHFQNDGRLQHGRRKLAKRGQYFGHSIALGYMVDIREYIDGEKNPNYKKYVRFNLTQPIVLRYFEIFYEEDGNLSRTITRIENEGPYIPEEMELRSQVPHGFYAQCTVTYHSPITGGRMPQYGTLQGLFSNAVYLGYWIYKGQLIKEKNHDAIIPRHLFDFAFNRLSKKTIYGLDNPDYQPYRPSVRHSMHKREGVSRPKYAGLICSNDMEGYTDKVFNTRWDYNSNYYEYVLKSTKKRRVLYYISASQLDFVIDKALQAHLLHIMNHEDIWQNLLEEKNRAKPQNIEGLKRQIKSLTRDLDKIAVEIPKHQDGTRLKNHLLRDYARKAAEIVKIQSDLEKLSELRALPKQVMLVKDAIRRVIENWDKHNTQLLYQLLMKLSKRILVTSIDKWSKQVRIEWLSGEIQEFTLQIEIRGRLVFTTAQVSKLAELILDQVEQWKILREFPNRSWQSLRVRGRRAINDQRKIQGLASLQWKDIYTLKATYPQEITWEETEEYQEECRSMSNYGQSISHINRHSISFDPIISALLPLVNAISA